MFERILERDYYLHLFLCRGRRERSNRKCELETFRMKQNKTGLQHLNNCLYLQDKREKLHPGATGAALRRRRENPRDSWREYAATSTA